jgi:hypothetical protein
MTEECREKLDRPIGGAIIEIEIPLMTRTEIRRVALIGEAFECADCSMRGRLLPLKRR